MHNRSYYGCSERSDSGRSGDRGIKKLASVINIIRVDVDWCFAVWVKCNNKEFVIRNVYTPYERQQNEDEYLNRLAFIS